MVAVEVPTVQRARLLLIDRDRDDGSIAQDGQIAVGHHVERRELCVNSSQGCRHATSDNAAYVVLAQALEAPLVTADAKLLEARKVGVEVRVLPPPQ